MATFWWQCFSHLNHIFCYKCIFFCLIHFSSRVDNTFYCIVLCTSYGFTANFFLLAYLSSQSLPVAHPSLESSPPGPVWQSQGLGVLPSCQVKVTLCCLPACHILFLFLFLFFLSALYWTHQWHPKKGCLWAQSFCVLNTLSLFLCFIDNLTRQRTLGECLFSLRIWRRAASRLAADRAAE